VYGVLSYHVGRRTRDIGIRVALGATPRSVRWFVVRQGVGRALAGIAVGLAASVFLTRWLESLLFGVTRHDPRALFGAAAILGLVAVGASYLPARRATRVDPLEALRSD
jgi:ABC-type antimicrobial peptide transport system permease subunit